MNHGTGEARAVPRLGDDHLVLRRWQIDSHDELVVLAAGRDEEAARYSPSISRVNTPADAKEWLSDRSSPDRIDWAMEHRPEDEEHGATVGRVGLAWIREETGVAEIGYWLLAHSRGQGIATGAVQLMMRWAFGPGGFGRLEIRHVPENRRSCRVADRCGFIAEGVQRGALVMSGVRHDLHLHAKLATDPV